MPESETTRKARDEVQRELDGYRRAVSAYGASGDRLLENHRNGLVGSLRSYFRAVSRDRSQEILEGELERVWYLQKLEREMPSIEAELLPAILSLDGESLGKVDVGSIHQFFMRHVERWEGQANVRAGKENSSTPSAALQSTDRVDDSGGSRPPDGESQPVVPSDGGALERDRLVERIKEFVTDLKNLSPQVWTSLVQAHPLMWWPDDPPPSPSEEALPVDQRWDALVQEIELWFERFDYDKLPAVKAKFLAMRSNTALFKNFETVVIWMQSVLMANGLRITAPRTMNKPSADSEPAVQQKAEPTGQPSTVEGDHGDDALIGAHSVLLQDWAQLEIVFVSDKQINPFVQGTSMEAMNYTEFGLGNRKSEAPRAAWESLRLLAEQGHLDPKAHKSGRPALESRVKEIRKALRRHYCCQGDPFRLDKRTYFPRFRIRCAPSCY